MKTRPKYSEMQYLNSTHLTDLINYTTCVMEFKAGLYRIWCGVHTPDDTSAFVNLARQLINCGLIAEWMASA